MLRYLSLAFCFVLSSTAFGAANKEQGRLENCGVVMQEEERTAQRIEAIDTVNASCRNRITSREVQP